MRIALFQPDIPQNTGNIFRLGACLGIKIDIIEPTGYVFDDKKFKRASMDYIKHIEYKRIQPGALFAALCESFRGVL